MCPRLEHLAAQPLLQVLAQRLLQVLQRALQRSAQHACTRLGRHLSRPPQSEPSQQPINPTTTHLVRHEQPQEHGGAVAHFVVLVVQAALQQHGDGGAQRVGQRLTQPVSRRAILVVVRVRCSPAQT